MDISIGETGRRFEKINERQSVHQKDTDFETCWQLPESVGHGHLIRVQLKPGLDLYVMNYDPKSVFQMTSNAWPSGFGFKFFLSGTMKYENRAFSGEMIMTKGFNRFAFFPISQGTGKCLSRDRVKVVTVAMSPSFLSSLFQDEPDRFPGLMAIDSMAPFYHISPNTSAMENAAWDIFNCSYHGSIRRLFLECKALELVAHQLERFFPSRGSGGISDDEREKIEHAREILIKRMDASPVKRDPYERFSMKVSRGSFWDKKRSLSVSG
jgi:AraC family transcriptional activator of pyochelin receptor